jgi:hypothetical protein
MTDLAFLMDDLEIHGRFQRIPCSEDAGTLDVFELLSRLSKPKVASPGVGNSTATSTKNYIPAIVHTISEVALALERILITDTP